MAIFGGKLKYGDSEMVPFGCQIVYMYLLYSFNFSNHGTLIIAQLIRLLHKPFL